VGHAYPTQLIRLLLAILLLMAVMPVMARELVIESGPWQVSLIELFTSEGCSSCPPADSWLSRYRNDASLWHRVVPVAFHVDYWDDLGWRDPLSSRSNSDRQRAYAKAWGGRGVYTPGFVVNGREWRGWFARQSPQLEGDPRAGVLRVYRLDGDRFEVEFSGGPGQRANLVRLGSGLQSQVAAGENAGRRLTHDFVVLEFHARPLSTRNGLATAVFTLGEKPGSNDAIAVWIDDPSDMRPVQAAGGWLGTP
jgi:hypothetical protein